MQQTEAEQRSWEQIGRVPANAIQAAAAVQDMTIRAQHAATNTALANAKLKALQKEMTFFDAELTLRQKKSMVELQEAEAAQRIRAIQAERMERGDDYTSSMFGVPIEFEGRVGHYLPLGRGGKPEWRDFTEEQTREYRARRKAETERAAAQADIAGEQAAAMREGRSRQGVRQQPDYPDLQERYERARAEKMEAEAAEAKSRISGERSPATRSQAVAEINAYGDNPEIAKDPRNVERITAGRRPVSAAVLQRIEAFERMSPTASKLLGDVDPVDIDAVLLDHAERFAKVQGGDVQEHYRTLAEHVRAGNETIVRDLLRKLGRR